MVWGVPNTHINQETEALVLLLFLFPGKCGNGCFLSGQSKQRQALSATLWKGVATTGCLEPDPFHSLIQGLLI